MADAVAFDYAGFVARYPEFAAVSSDAAALYFAEATLFWRNDGTSPNSTAASQTTFLNMLTAHIAWMNAPRDANGNPTSAPGSEPAPPLVGRISDASEGSVSVSTEYADSTPGTMAWFVQTKYGAAFWQATAQYRMARYRTGPRRSFEPVFPRFRSGW